MSWNERKHQAVKVHYGDNIFIDKDSFGDYQIFYGKIDTPRNHIGRIIKNGRRWNLIGYGSGEVSDRDIEIRRMNSIADAMKMFIKYRMMRGLSV